MNRPPAWLQAHLEATGAANSDGVGRTAFPRRCRECSALTLVGLDGDIAALPARVDPFGLDAHGELAALIAGRATYNVWKARSGYELCRRDSFHVRGLKVAQIAAQHVCGHVLPGRPLPSPTQSARVALVSEDSCPF